MSCRKWTVEISKWQEGELSEEREAGLLRHLERCRHCQSLEARLRAVSALLKTSPEPPVPHVLSQRITASVSERMRHYSDTWVSRVRGFFSYRNRPAFTTALLVIALCLGSLAGHNIARFTNFSAEKPSYDLLTLGGIGARSQAIAFSFVWQDNGEGGRP